LQYLFGGMGGVVGNTLCSYGLIDVINYHGTTG
jgi:hypothetical protein